jgi:Dna[CI] antecedent, DciA
MREFGELERVAGEVREHLRRFGPGGGVADLADAWPAAVGAEISRHAWPARIRGNGTLVVHVRDSIWGFELTQRSAEIRSRLPGAPPLVFVPGPLPAGDSESQSAARRGPEATLEQTREAAAWAAGIADEELRGLVARAAAASLARAAADRPV